MCSHAIMLSTALYLRKVKITLASTSVQSVCAIFHPQTCTVVLDSPKSSFLSLLLLPFLLSVKVLSPLEAFQVG